MTFIIVFELSQPAQNRESVIQRIKASGAWARLTHSAYLVSVAHNNPVMLRDQVNEALGQNDRVYVAVAPAPSAWAGMPEDVAKWILANQK